MVHNESQNRYWLSFIKSPFGPGLPGGGPRGAHGTTTLGPCTGIYLEFRSHRNVSEKGDRVARPETVRDASTLLLPKCTGDADRRFSPLPGGRELHQASDSAGRALGVSLFSPI